MFESESGVALEAGTFLGRITITISFSARRIVVEWKGLASKDHDNHIPQFSQDRRRRRISRRTFLCPSDNPAISVSLRIVWVKRGQGWNHSVRGAKDIWALEDHIYNLIMLRLAVTTNIQYRTSMSNTVAQRPNILRSTHRLIIPSRHGIHALFNFTQMIL